MIIFLEVLILPLRSFKVSLLKVSCACHQTCPLLPAASSCGSRLDLSQQMASLSTKCSEGMGCQCR